jgi:hypothetical protein
MRPIVVAAVLVAAGASASVLYSRHKSIDLSPNQDLAVAPVRRLAVQPSSNASYAEGTELRGFAAPREIDIDNRHSAALEKRIAELESRLEEESAERKRLEEQLAALTSRLASSTNVAGQPEMVQVASAAPAPAAPMAQPAAPADASPLQSSAPAAPPVDYSVSPMERALAAAGLDAETAADIKYRQDELVMSEMYLRDQATREQWMDTPRFREEMAKIDAQRTSVRDEIGDDAYDRYLFALGQTNRVRVDDVLAESPAAGVGLQSGDMIIRYGDARLFAPRDLVDQTHGGSLGETVRLEVSRNGERFEVEVPRGPLGLRVNAIQDKPDAS